MKNTVFFLVLIITLVFWSSYAMDSKAPSNKYDSSKVNSAAPKRKLSFGTYGQLPAPISMPLDLSLLGEAIDEPADEVDEPKAPKMEAIQGQDDIPPLSLDDEKQFDVKTEYRNPSPMHKKPRLRSRSLFQGERNASSANDTQVGTILGVFKLAKKEIGTRRCVDPMRDEVIQETLKIILSRAFACIDHKRS